MPVSRPSACRRGATLVAALALALLAPATPALAVPAPDPMAGEAWPIADDGPIGAQSAWDRTTGGDVIVAVIDSGIDLGHPDLVPNLWRNPGEVPANGVDDDGNGSVDDVHGVDVVNGDGDPTDDNGHGTHVAGILGARGGNGIGAAGIAWRVRIMAVKVLDHAAAGSTATVARGVDYALANGARILNLSLAGNQRSTELDHAIARARAAGALVVTAAGNQRSDLALVPAWPAVSAEPNVLAVAASTPSGALSAISSFGAPVDLVAPGDAVFATALGGGYEWRTGTSMAAPLVAGTAALVATATGTTDAGVLRHALLAGARPAGVPIGGGALDAARAIHAVTPAAARSSTTDRDAIAGTWTATGDDEAEPSPRRRSTLRSRRRGRLTVRPLTGDSLARDRHHTARVPAPGSRASARARSRAKARASQAPRLPRSVPVRAAG